MSPIKYLLSAFFFMVIIFAGVNVTLSEFNRDIYPEQGIRVFAVDGVRHGSVDLEVLGAKKQLILPEYLEQDLLQERAITAFNNILEAGRDLGKQSPEQAFKKTLKTIRSLSDKIAADLNFCARYVTGDMSWEEDLPGHGEER